MSKRHGDDSADNVPSKKANLIEDVNELEKKLLNAEQEMAELQAVIANNKARVEQESVFNCNQEMNEKKCADLELTNQLEVVKESILKLKSQKNRLLNPVSLSFPLYADIFKEVNHQKKVLNLKDVLKFFLIGKETHLPIVQFMRKCVQIEFKYTGIYWKNGDANIKLPYCKFSENLIKRIIPYVTKVSLDCENPANFQRLFFETLSKHQEQKSLEIRNIWFVNNIVIEALKKLNELNVPIKLCYPLFARVLHELPGVHFEILKIGGNIKKWFHFLATNSLPCTFTKLQLPHVQLRSRQEWGKEVVANVEELFITWDFNLEDDFFGRLYQHFPNAQKLSVTFMKRLGRRPMKYFDEPKYSKYMWNRRKNYITNAPQKEIVANFGYVADSKRKYERAIKLFGGERIDDKTLRWTSPSNNSKIINFHHRLSAVKVDHVDVFGGSDINSESGLSDEEIDSDVEDL
uniref:Uncharacterized protein n=1 Tax=Panagrolaimus sp. JU765 TaxID=591449 RepID=A0AC34QL69_9BILA